jgi:hypothetical protein
MPYKDPERKRQWVRQLREQRNARRRALRLAAETNTTPKPAPNTNAGQAPTTGWKAFAGLAVGIGIALLGALARAGFLSDMGPSAGWATRSSNSP